MARENKTKYAILGLLAGRPMSGYDIKKSIGQSLGNFWSESYGQIYPVVKTLTGEGLATKSVERQEGKPDRHVYTITEKGLQELRRWLIEPAEPHKERVEVLLKLFFGKEVPVPENIQHVRRFREEHLSLLEKYSGIKKFLQSEYSGDANLPYWLLTVNCGLHVSKSMLEWCDETMETLKELDKGGSDNENHGFKR